MQYALLIYTTTEGASDGDRAADRPADRGGSRASLVVNWARLRIPEAPRRFSDDTGRRCFPTGRSSTARSFWAV